MKKPAFASEESQIRELLVAELAKSGDTEKIAREQFDRSFFGLVMLAQHYEIPIRPNVFSDLALALARELFPEPKKTGRRQKWHNLNMGVLVVEIERLVDRDDPAHGINWASKQLAKREVWRAFLDRKDTPETIPDPGEALRKAYFKFKDHKWANIVREAFADYEAKGIVARWDEYVQIVVKKP